MEISCRSISGASIWIYPAGLSGSNSSTVHAGFQLDDRYSDSRESVDDGMFAEENNLSGC
ncbi:MAG: hypothetical protein AB9891_17210 [Anaerolineaceae bacterium]